VPRDPSKNVASIAAAAWLRQAGIDKRPIVSVEKGLALAGGMGGSAASAVAGACAAALAVDHRRPPLPPSIMSAALEAEANVAGRHLDNIAASTLGGLTISRSVDPVDAVRVTVPETWAVVLVTPHVRIETRAARAILPPEWPAASWIQQMANTTALAYAFASGDEDLLRRSLDDRYAEPQRARLIPRFREIKRAALEAGALGCSISGSGPTIFAITRDLDPQCAEAMRRALAEVKCDVHVARIAREGVRKV
jgi:homoserine kinase